jgi:hypothetical protein
MFIEVAALFLVLACMTVKPPPPVVGTTASPTQPIARPDLPVVCRQLNEWTTENWPSAQTGVITKPTPR